MFDIDGRKSLLQPLKQCKVKVGVDPLVIILHIQCIGLEKVEQIVRHVGDAGLDGRILIHRLAVYGNGALIRPVDTG